ncbi:hypothetical protein [Granulicoccus phenolivorans]|uniref:hypothetical protein n=1 Tax=Granulicoccus phenolivorans TaxID=266854 RepID=UPI00040EBA04|nr:hypothetical protein [Granulicoccus phenolivorans]
MQHTFISGSRGVVEYAITPKSDDRPCEDALVITDDFVAVIDGMSDPQGDLAPGEVAGHSTQLAHAITALPPDIAATEALAILAALPTRAGAVLAIFSRTRREIWRVGDVNWAVDGVHHVPTKRVDDAMTLFRSAVNHAHLAAGAGLEDIITTDPGLTATFPLLHAQRSLANQPGPWGYGVLNGTPIPAEHLAVVDVTDATEVVLTSDGYPVPAASLAAAERELAEALLADPACLDRLAGMGKAPKPGAHGPDDRTYVRIRPADTRHE